MKRQERKFSNRLGLSEQMQVCSEWQRVERVECPYWLLVCAVLGRSVFVFAATCRSGPSCWFVTANSLIGSAIFGLFNRR